MAFSHGSVAKILVDGYTAPPVKEVSLEAECDTAETSILGTTDKTYVPGLRDATMSFSGIYDSDLVTPANAFAHKLNALQGSFTQCTYMPAGDVNGYPAFLVKGFLTSASIETSVDDMAGFEAELQNTTGLERGTVYHALTARTATGTSTGVDNDAGSTDGLSAILHVAAVSGTTPTLTVTIEGSDDSTNGVDGNWATVATFAQATGKTSEYVAVTGAVEQWLRVKWTVAGTTPSFTFHVAVHRK